jgi:hypothetical protein
MPIRDDIDSSAARVHEKEEKREEATKKLGEDQKVSLPWRAGPAAAHAADAITTLQFLKEGGTEGGAAKIIGKRPSTAAVLGFKAAQALIGDIGVRTVAKKSKTAAKILSVVSGIPAAKAAVGNAAYAKRLREKRTGGKR